MFLLDTNVVSELRPGKRGASPAVLDWAAGQDFELMHLSAVTVLELRLGMELKARRDAAQAALLRAWIESLEAEFDVRILPFTLKGAQACAPMHVPQPRSWRDSLIAATAREHGFTVVTRNTQDFEGMGVALLNPWLPAPTRR